MTSTPILQSRLTLSGHSEQVLCLDSSFGKPVSTLLGSEVVASGSEDRTVRLWDCRSGKVIKAIRGFLGPVVSLSFHRSQDEANYIYVASSNKVSTFDLRHSNLILKNFEDSVSTFSVGTEDIGQIAINFDGSLGSIASDDGTVCIKEFGSLTEVKSFQGHTNLIGAIDFHPNGKHLASGGMDHQIQLWNIRGLLKSWDMDTAVQVDASTLPGVNPKFVCCLAFPKSGSYLAGGLGDGSIRLINLSQTSKKKTKAKRLNWDQISLPLPHSHIVSKIIFLDSHPPRCTKLISGSTDGSIKIWEIPNDLQSLSSPHIDCPSQYNLDVISKINDMCLVGSQGRLAVTGVAKTLGSICIYDIQP